MGASFCGFWMVPFRHLPCRDDFALQMNWPDRGRRIRILGWRAHWVVGVVALRPLRPRRAGGPSYYPPVADEANAPLCAARRLAARAVPPTTRLLKTSWRL